MLDTLESRLLFALDNGVDPFNLGHGDWVWQIASARASAGVSTNAQLFQYLKNKGMKWVTVKCGDGSSIWSQFTTTLVNEAHAAGLKIFGWAYMYGSNTAGEAEMAKACLAKGADGFIIDAEAEYRDLANNAAAAQTFCTTVRAAYPNRFLAHAPFPIVSYHSAFPYYTFGKHCDAVMPQDYWDAIGVSATYMNTWRNNEWNTLYNGWRGTSKADAIKPIIPIGHGWNVSSTNTLQGQEILDFVTALKTTSNPASPGGYKGVSWWSVQHHNADHWNAIGQVRIGNPTFAVDQTIRVNGTGTSGLKAWSNSSSVAPTTYIVKPEGAVGTIVSGPVFAEGYNRWEIRWKDETTTRWSAEDYLIAASAPGAVTNVAPADGATFTTPPATLSWQQVDVATSYDVYFDGVLRANVTGTNWTIPTSVMAAGNHFWEIRSKNSAGVTAGTIWDFTYSVPLPAMPSNPSPGNVTYPQVRPTVLDWSDSAGATSYDVYWNGVFAANVMQSRWTITQPVLLKTNYNWQVRAKNAGGTTSGWVWYFRVEPLTGDANADGRVDHADFTIVWTNFGKSATTFEAGDFTGDGRTDFADFQSLERNFGRVAAGGASVIEEAGGAAKVFAVTRVGTKTPKKR